MILTRVRRSVAAMIGSVERNSENVEISLKQVVKQKSLIKEKKAENLEEKFWLEVGESRLGIRDRRPEPNFF